MTSGGGERPRRMDEAAAIIASTDYMTLATRGRGRPAVGDSGLVPRPTASRALLWLSRPDARRLPQPARAATPVDRASSTWAERRSE